METETQIYKNIIDNQVFPYLSDNENLNLTYNKELVKCVAILCFDDEIGQVTENIWPQDSLDATALKNITGLGFPETNYLSDDGEIQYIFKIRQSK